MYYFILSKTTENLQWHNLPLLFIIKNLRLRTFIGIKEEEINNRQDIVINVTIHYPADKARTSEDINDALNYRTVTKNIIQHVENNRSLCWKN